MPASPLRHSACKWCYRDLPLAQLAAAAPKIGLESIELLDPEDFAVVRRHDLTCAMVSFPTGETPAGTTVGGIPRAWNRLEHHDTLVAIYEKRLAETSAAGFQNVICFSGNRDGLDDEQGLENCATGLRRVLPFAEKHGVTLVMELLNSKVDHPGYMCDRTAWGVALAETIGSERFKLLYDIYHMQIMEGDVIRAIRAHHRHIAHYHTAGNPGRHEFEPQDAQELNYPAIMRAIRETGYRGFIGQEFIPVRDPLASLQAAITLCAV